MNNKVLAGVAAAAIALASPLVAYYEGTVTHTYVDPVGIPTICTGHTGADVTAGKQVTAEQCKALLNEDLREAYVAVQQCVRAPLRDNEAAALISFTFNVGGHAFCSSTMARLINSGAPASTWCHQLTRWTKATHLGVAIELPGLVKRRNAELAMCLGSTT
jgi:lysozyme